MSTRFGQFRPIAADLTKLRACFTNLMQTSPRFGRFRSNSGPFRASLAYVCQTWAESDQFPADLARAPTSHLWLGSAKGARALAPFSATEGLRTSTSHSLACIMHSLFASLAADCLLFRRPSILCALWLQGRLDDGSSPCVDDRLDSMLVQPTGL